MTYVEEIQKRRKKIAEQAKDWVEARDGFEEAKNARDDALQALRDAQAASDDASRQCNLAESRLAISRKFWDDMRHELGRFVVEQGEAFEEAVMLAQPPAFVGSVGVFQQFVKATSNFVNLTFDDFARGLMNVGVDVKCGACAMKFFTGSMTVAHTCNRKVTP